jgi:branched-chain amino acid transport system permease protein
MEFFTQQLVNGITLGSLYALLAIGYSIVYGVIGLLNFAQGEVYMVGAFIGFGVLGSWRSERTDGSGRLALVLMFAAAALGSGARVLIERVAFRPLRDSSRMAPSSPRSASRSSCRTPFCFCSARHPELRIVELHPVTSGSTSAS